MTIAPPEKNLSDGAESGKEGAQQCLDHEILIAQEELGVNNPEGVAEVMRFREGTEIECKIEGQTVTVIVHYADSEFVDGALTTGTNPVLGGDGGIVTHADGHTSMSNVPEQFWGTPAAWLAIQPELIKENIDKQIATVVPQDVKEGFLSDQESLSEGVAEQVVPYIAEGLGDAQ